MMAMVWAGGEGEGRATGFTTKQEVVNGRSSGDSCAAVLRVQRLPAVPTRATQDMWPWPNAGPVALRGVHCAWQAQALHVWHGRVPYSCSTAVPTCA